MVKVPVNITNTITSFIAALERNHFHIEQVFLFGSYAKGTFNEWSDIDIALVSNNFSGYRFLDKQKIRKIKASIDFSLSPLPFRPEDFDESNLFVKEILETGIRII
ncbi:MAG: nucleotidyltransferase domain-containing protein [Ignavibacteria bacterium]|nr:nucleotidyltransferase domain-containing protein [Ignavibacteria bacterium]